MHGGKAWRASSTYRTSIFIMNCQLMARVRMVTMTVESNEDHVRKLKVRNLTVSEMHSNAPLDDGNSLWLFLRKFSQKLDIHMETLIISTYVLQLSKPIGGHPCLPNF